MQSLFTLEVIYRLPKYRDPITNCQWAAKSSTVNNTNSSPGFVHQTLGTVANLFTDKGSQCNTWHCTSRFWKCVLFRRASVCFPYPLNQHPLQIPSSAHVSAVHKPKDWDFTLNLLHGHWPVALSLVESFLHHAEQFLSFTPDSSLCLQITLHFPLL